MPCTTQSSMPSKEMFLEYIKLQKFVLKAINTLKMHLQIVLIFGIILLKSFINADLVEDTRKLIDLVIDDEAEALDAECFNQIKDVLINKLEIAGATNVERVESDNPVFKKGLRLNMGNFINELLPRNVVDSSDGCLHQAKHVLRNSVKNRFYEAFKIIDPDF
ncbi:uncharacterized protein LOC105262539 [Musca domestica]|uniref:Uncharacterized protein LOC105262539 n=1 Tax=Musca domestica TaxID=7370 RepID=A0A1I8NJS4_MUSDO|nr:uncharacterized protein LOC105262539 [Musca domestica]